MTKTYCRNPATLVRRTHDAVLLLAPGTREVITISGAGRALWDVLAVPRSLDEITAALAAQFAASPQAVRPDVAEALRALTARQIVAEVGGQS